jgi:hypothetical protein
MNFEIKSTFRHLRMIVLHLRTIRLSWWIIVINVASATTVVALYLTNHIIPATIGARPHGELYLDLIELAIVVKAFATAFAIAEVCSAALPERTKTAIVNVAASITAFPVRIWKTIAWQRTTYTRIVSRIRGPFSSIKK